VPPTLPEPFLDIARHCLVRDPQERWTVVQIAARLQERTQRPKFAHRCFSPAPPRASRHSRKLCGRQAPCETPRLRYSGYTAGVVLVLAAIVAWPRLSHRHSEVRRPLPSRWNNRPFHPHRSRYASAGRAPTKVSKRRSLKKSQFRKLQLPCLPPFIPRLRVRSQQ